MQKIAMVQESFRLTVENSQKLEQIKQQTGQTKNSLVNKMIAEYQIKGAK